MNQEQFKNLLEQDSNWVCAFEYTSPGNTHWCVADKNKEENLTIFSVDDVKEIISLSDGENEGPNWLLFGQLNNDLFFFLSAGCDYTGWDCQAGGSTIISKSKENILMFGMDDDDRKRLKLSS